MISLKNEKELAAMRIAGRISAQALQVGGKAVAPGVSTAEIDKIIYDFIISQGAKPAFLGYAGFPASACISINNEVIHGIPSKERIIKEGDIVKIDTGAVKDGFYGDNAATFGAGRVSAEAKALMDATFDSLKQGVLAAKPGNRIGDIAAAVQAYAEGKGFAVVRDYVGHGVGRNLHESPDVPNYGIAGHGLRLLPGMTLAIEPMINARGVGVKSMPDGWTVLTASGSLSAHFEYTVAITKDGAEILTTP